MSDTSSPCPAIAAFTAASVFVALEQSVNLDWLLLTTNRRLIVVSGPTLADAKTQLPAGEDVRDACPLTDSSHREKLKTCFPSIIFI